MLADVRPPYGLYYFSKHEIFTGPIKPPESKGALGMKFYFFGSRTTGSRLAFNISHNFG